MVQKTRRRVLVAGVLASAGLMNSRIANAALNGKATIALVMKSPADPFTMAMLSAAQNYQKHFASQFDLVVRSSDAQPDTAAQIRIVEDLIASHINAIVLVPTDSKALVPVVARAIDAGIIVTTIDNPLDEAALQAAHIAVPFIGPDNLKGARLVANYLASKLKPGDEVGIIEGVVTDRNAQQRTDGFREAMNAAHIKIAAIAPGDWVYSKAKAAASVMLDQHPHIRGLLCANDSMATGAVDAVRIAHRTGNVYITGYNNDASITSFIDSGRILATVDQFAARQAVFGVDVALKALDEHTREQDLSPFIETPLQLVTGKTR
ncbi:substrate-binding domain-containing protein [Paraburkholderia sp. DHOC27]|uniref:substrate-binding domain-containing protein n=1 Tax=Paraburkholderia sp. DHOC27 TaxID=2303330 RepID=UPI000E3E365E|nr:substrate-binding domain-containing protein [Paraburkholderia sp. DHOC27]RFU46536.1 sugar ABC transporter substrate-binding protein [Paraburkholderia sp. DHOC27]